MYSLIISFSTTENNTHGKVSSGKKQQNGIFNPNRSKKHFSSIYGTFAAKKYVKNTKNKVNQ